MTTEQLSFPDPEHLEPVPISSQPPISDPTERPAVFNNPYREQESRARDIIEARGEDLAFEQTGIPTRVEEDGEDAVDDESLPYEEPGPDGVVEMPGQRVGRSNDQGLLTTAEARRRREQDSSPEEIRQMQAAARVGLAIARANLRRGRNRER
jgi:hypothetical protein